MLGSVRQYGACLGFSLSLSLSALTLLALSLKINLKNKYIKATRVTCFPTQAGETYHQNFTYETHDKKKKKQKTNKQTNTHVNLKGVFEFCVDSRCQLLESKDYAISFLIKSSRGVEILKPTELMAKIHLDLTKPCLS